jgi:DNA transposition AAA+ family ATPase
MKPTFVETRNYHRFMEGMDALDARGSEECRLVVVDGLPGLGKTTILARWATQESCLYLRAKVEWTPYWMMAELLAEAAVTPPHGHEARFRACIATLRARMGLARATGAQFAVVIDEADYVSRHSKLVDAIRDLADLAEVPIILVGMGRIRDNLTRHPQTASRISRYVRFEPADLADVEEFLAAKCDVPVAKCLASFVHRATGGFNRELLEAIRSIERFGHRNPPAAPEGLTAREMAGQHLINDRKSGQPIAVPVR